MWCYLQDVGTEAATATCRPCDLATLLTLIADFCTVGPQTWSVKYFRLTSIWENHSQLDFYFPYGLKPIISFRRGMFGRSSGTKLCFLCFRVSCLCWCWWWWGWWWRRPFCAKHVVHAHATWRCIRSPVSLWANSGELRWLQMTKWQFLKGILITSIQFVELQPDWKNLKPDRCCAFSQ